MKYTSIRVTVLVNLLILTLLTAGALIGIQYYFSDRLVLSAAADKLSEISDTIQLQSNQLAEESDTLLNVLEEYETLSSPVHHERRHPAMGVMIKSLTQHPHAYALYIAHQNGDFYEIINLKSDPVLYPKLSAPSQAHWAIITLSADDQHRTKRFSFVDEKLQFLSSRLEETAYSPAERPWFKNAINAQAVHQTQPYLFAHLNAPGVTFSKQIKNTQTVIAIDFTTDFLTRNLVSKKPTADSEIFVFNDDAQILFHSDQVLSASPSFNQLERITLSESEQAVVDQNKVWLVSNQLNWAPFDFQERGEAMGYSVDFLKLISAKTGLSFKFLNDYTWEEIMSAFGQGRLDLVHALYKNRQREQIGAFTQPYYPLNNFFITHQSTPDIRSFNVLRGKTLALIKGWSMNELIQQQYPEIKVRLYDSIVDALKAVSNQEATATIDTDHTFLHLKTKFALHNLKLNYPLPASSKIRETALYIMVSKQQPLLLSVLNKAIASITEAERLILEQKWGLTSQSLKRDLALKNRVPDPVMALLEQQRFGEVIKIKVDGKTYLAAYQPLMNGRDVSHTANKLAIMIPRDTLLAPYYEIMIYSILLAFGVLMLMIPFTYFQSGQIVKPILQLMQMNRLIEQQRYHEVRPVNTYVVELHKLSDSLISLSNSIQEYQKSQSNLLDSIIKLIAEAIDAKSPYTGSHCKKVPELALMILEAANLDQKYAFKSFKITSKEELHAFEMAAWLHDCGKVTTPEYIMDKATKLETVYNRIHEIRTRFEVVWRDAEISYYQSLLSKQDPVLAQQTLQARQQELQQQFEWIASINLGNEQIVEGLRSKLENIASTTWVRHFDNRLGLSEIELDRYSQQPTDLPVVEKLLDDKPEHIIARTDFDCDDYQHYGFKTPVPEHLYQQGELYNLSIEKGTLNAEERFKIQEHVMMTIKMLSALPFPPQYANIPEYAGTHHETMIGTGYPRQLNKNDLSVPARIMIVADVFEALTASDRPYKHSHTLSQALHILSDMRDKQHIDSDVFELFLHSGVYLQYAHKHLKPQQMDPVNINDYL